MDKELAQLQKEVIKRLIEYEDQLQALGDTNQLKKTKRVSSSVAINIAAFPDLIQSLLDSGVETKKIVKELRNFQEGLLRDTVTIKGTETAHHQGMLRTGGSFYRADPEIWQGSVAKLADFFETQFGDVPENIRSYINWAHKSDTNTKGIEKALFGAVANPDPSLTAHPFGTVARSLTKDLSPEELSDPDKFFDAMAKRIDVQLEAVKVADQISRPLVETIQQNIDPRAYRAPDIPTNIEIQKKVLLPENRPIIEKGIVEVVQGSAKWKGRQLYSMDPISMAMDPLIKNPTGAAAGVLMDAYNKETIQKLEQGDVIGAGEDVLKGAVTGAAIESGAKMLGPKATSILGRVVAPVAGASLLTEGREGSTTDYVLDKYGKYVGMNRDRPSWGTEFGEMNTQKPGYVQATEDAIDTASDFVVNTINGSIKLLFGSPKPETEEDLNFSTL